MKINPDLKIRTIAGEAIILLPTAKENETTKVLSLNSTSRLLWEKLSGVDFTCEDVITLLLDNYEVDRERAAADAQAWIKQLTEINVIQ